MGEGDGREYGGDGDKDLYIIYGESGMWLTDSLLS